MLPLQNMNKIKLFVMDVDGTMTDGCFTVDIFGNETKTFNVKDGMAIELLTKTGIKTAIITGHNSKVVENRSKQLDIDYYYVSNNKIETLKNIILKMRISPNEVCYIGDDLNDINVINFVGVSGCPNDACSDIKNIVTYVCKKNGGYGAVREFAEYIIKDNKQ